LVKPGITQVRGLLLTVAAGSDPALLAACSNCGRELQLNPFIVDNRESQKYKVIDNAIFPVARMVHPGRGCTEFGWVKP
jgi:hypothetical protein